jgi:hypothetical protein
MEQKTKTFKKDDCFRIPWDMDLKDATFIVYEIYQDPNDRQLLYAHDINDEETVVSIHSEEVLPI